MKKIKYLGVVLLTCGTLLVFSQTSDSKINKFSIGIVGGLNFADMYFPNSQEPDDQEISNLLRFAAGAVLDIQLSKKLFFRFEPMYLQKGGKIEEGNDLVNQPEGKIKLSTIEIPILIQYIFGNKINPFLIAGPTFGFNLNPEIEFDLTGLQFKGDLKDVTETIDLGLTFGGGIQAPLSFGCIFLEGRYTYGVINQRKSGTVIVSSNGFQFEMDSDKEDDKYTNRGFQLLLGINYTIK